MPQAILSRWLLATCMTTLLASAQAQSPPCVPATAEIEDAVALADGFLRLVDAGQEDAAFDKFEPNIRGMGDVARLQLRRNMALRAERGALRNRRVCIQPKRAERSYIPVVMIIDEDAERTVQRHGLTLTTAQVVIRVWRDPQGRPWMRSFDVQY